MILQFSDIEQMILPIMSIFVFIILIVLMVIFYLKKRVFVITLVIHLFSLVIGISALEIPNFPFTPWFQTFFIVFQTVFLLLVSIDVFKLGKG